MNPNQDYKNQLVQYATEYIIGEFGIWERYNKERYKSKRRTYDDYIIFYFVDNLDYKWYLLDKK